MASSDHDEPVPYRSLPVSDFIREVLLGTPQGLACVFSCVLWLGAGVIWLFLTPEARSIPMLAMAEGFFFFPILLLLVFVWGNAGSRASKVEPSLLVALVYIAAGLYPFIHAYLPSDIDVAGFVLAIVLALGI